MNASVPVIKPHLGKLFKTKRSLRSQFIHPGNKGWVAESNTVMMLYRVEDVGDTDDELPNQIVCYFLLEDRNFIRAFKHSGDFFDELNLLRF